MTDFIKMGGYDQKLEYESSIVEIDNLINSINELSTFKRDDTVEVNHSSLIIWNASTPSVTINKTASQLDFLPTIYNLFGIDYDSRLFMGKDILSTES